MPLKAEVAAIDHQFGAFLDALGDPAFDAGLVLGGDDGAVVRLVVGRDADAQRVDLGDHPFTEDVGGPVADRHHHRQGHAALAGRTKGGPRQVLDHLIHVGVGQDDAVVLGAAHGLHALMVGRARLIDVVGDVRRADEADGVHQRVGQDGVHGRLVAVHHVQHAVGRARLQHQFGQADRHGRIALRRLQHECVADRDGHAEHPHRDHGGKVERGDAGDHAQRLAHGVDVDAGASALGVFAFQSVGDAAGEFDHLQPPLDVALGVGDDLAVLARQHLGQLVHVRLDQALELKHDARAALGVRRGPAFKGVLRRLDRTIDLSGAGQLHTGLNLAAVRIEHVREPTAGAVKGRAVDEVADVSHAGVSLIPVLGDCGDHSGIRRPRPFQRRPRNAPNPQVSVAHGGFQGQPPSRRVYPGARSISRPSRRALRP